MKSTWIVIMAVAVVLTGGMLWAQTSNTAPRTPMATPQGQTMGPGMNGSMMPGQRGMMNRLGAMDAELDTLVQRMQKAHGRDKIDVTAAVVSKLVAQQRALNQAMAWMQPGTMMQMMHNMPMGYMHRGGGMMGSGMPYQHMMGGTTPSSARPPAQQ